MANDKYQEFEENLRLRNKLLKIGIGCPIIGPTGPTERLFKSSNKIIIDSSLIIPYNEKKIIYFTIFPKKCHLLFFVTIFTIKLSNIFFIYTI